MTHGAQARGFIKRAHADVDEARVDFAREEVGSALTAEVEHGAGALLILGKDLVALKDTKGITWTPRECNEGRA